MRLWCVLVLTAMGVRAQDALAAQRASVERQRAAIAAQVGLARPRAVLFRPRCAPVAAGEIEQMLDSAARAEQLPVKLVREVARQESALDPCAVSLKGAQGVMQLMPATQAQLGVRDPFNPQENVLAGVRLLKALLTRYGGDLALALSAYNAGPLRVDQAGGIPDIAETQNYVQRILARLTD
jgi:soluble lytic murein transglycosylase-like protein